MHGRLKNEVHFGILGHLYPGGTFDVRQAEIGSDHWEMTLLRVNMRSKALFFKTINVQQDEVRSHFRQVPDNLTLTQAKEILQKPPGDFDFPAHKRARPPSNSEFLFSAVS